ncbi:MAG TPA: flavodoxin [Acidimicrobiales bacterium]|jgi:multimeric flavodoxin WrbA|nr:flavodoxin [Acidimicrobiales bacterium]
MSRLLVVHHTPSPNVHAMVDAVVRGARTDDVEDVEVVVRPALVCSATEVLEADGYLLGTPANLGYMSGALKHFFDTIYYPCLDATVGRPFGSFLHGNDDVAGAQRAIEKIVTGLRWRRVATDVVVTGHPARDDLDRCWELGATLAATVASK